MTEFVFKKPKDIELGDIVRGYGIIVEIDLEDKDLVFNAPHWHYFSYNDSYSGRCCCEIDLEQTYELVISEKEKIAIYNSVRKGFMNNLVRISDDLRILNSEDPRAGDI